MPIYFLTILALIVIAFLVVKFLKWKITAKVLFLFCKEQFREPTDEEISGYTNRIFKKLSNVK